jgi:hypothetical protein
VNSLTFGHIRVRDNVITGAQDAAPGDGSSYGLYVPIAFGPAFASYNIFFGNEDDSNNAIDVQTGPGNGNNIPEDHFGAVADPLFDGSPEFGYLAGSPALNSSSTAPSVLTGNRGYNQDVNSNAPVIQNTTASGVAPQNLASPFLANEDILIDWDFVDADSPQDDNQTDFTVYVSTDITFVDPGQNVFVFNGIIDGGDGSVTQVTIPGGTTVQNTTYYVRVFVYDQTNLTDFDNVSFVTSSNTAPTASAFLVDGVASNLNVSNSNPEFSFVYDDIDGDNMASVTIKVYRVSQNCGINCNDLNPPMGDPLADAGGQYEIANKTVLVGSPELPGPVAPGDVVALSYYDLSVIIGDIIHNEEYQWTVIVNDGTVDSDEYGPGAVAPFLDANLVFATEDIFAPSFAELEVDDKDNSEVRVVLGNPVPANAPVFSFVYTGSGTLLIQVV